VGGGGVGGGGEGGLGLWGGALFGGGGGGLVRPFSMTYQGEAKGPSSPALQGQLACLSGPGWRV